MRYFLLILILTNFVFGQQEGKLKKAEKKESQPVASEKKSQESGNKKQKKRNAAGETDFYLVEKHEMGNMAASIMERRNSGPTVTYVEERLSEFIPGYANMLEKMDLEMPRFQLNVASEMDVQREIPALINEFARLKKYWVVCMKPENILTSSFYFMAIPRKLTDAEVSNNVIVSSASLKKYGVPTLTVKNLAVAANLGIRISNDAQANITINPVLYTYVRPAPGSGYDKNYQMGNVNGNGWKLEAASQYEYQFISPKQKGYVAAVATEFNYAVGATGILETTFLKDFGDFLNSKNIESNCSLLAEKLLPSTKTIVSTADLSTKKSVFLNGPAFKVYIAKNLTQSYEGEVRILSTDKLEITTDLEKRAPAETVQISLEAIEKVAFNPSFVGGCQIMLYIKKESLDLFPENFPLRNKLLSKKKYVEIYRHKEKVQDACKFLAWLKETDLNVEQEG